MKVLELIEKLYETVDEHGDLEVLFSDYEHYTNTDEDREVNLLSVFEQDGKVYVTDAPWWECP